MKAALGIADCLCHNLRKTSRQVTQFYDDALRPSGIRVTQFSLLAAIGKMGEVSLAPLADFLGMDRTTLTRNLDVLERDGLVVLRAGDEDRRRLMVTLSGRGRKVLGDSLPLWEKAQRQVLRRLAHSSLADFLESLADLSRAD